ncbi:phage tail tape-measure protein [Paenibacillus faecis]|uniref:Phage tail tape-measure protein n=1 Tax=Paenibacillus faecis TaxID=862114 RepID=A0A5D0CM40_9BACL|nr:phage tail tape measure protein [Paenibacillus faecis]TYA10931.1 phage tail tape-measure protein [Paenibacillus faecis]
MAGKKQYEMSFELNGKIDPRLTRSFDSLSRDVTGLEKDLGQLRRTKSLDKITREADHASGAFGELRENVREFGDILQRVGQYTGAYAIIEKVTGSIGEMVSTIGQLDAQSGQLGAATGATAEELQELQGISQSLYRQGLGEGVNDLTDALVVARNVTKQQGDELERTAKNAIVLQDVFRFDIPESLKASDTMMRQFSITSEQSMNLLAQGAQRGLDKSGELLDSANEYAPQFAALGYSANEMFDFFAAGLEAGAWNLDKVGDLAKEFNIRIQDGSDKTASALAALFAPDDIEKFTMALTKGGTKSAEYLELLKHVSADTAKQMVKDLQKGGKGSEDTFKALSGIMGEGNKILTDLSTGALKGKDVMQKVIAQLNSIDNKVYRNALGVELFGTQWEDLEKDVVAALGNVQHQFHMTESTMEDMAAVKYDNLAQDLKVLGRELMEEVVIPIGEDLMPVLRDLTAWASDNKDLIKTLALAVPAGMLAKNTVSMGKDFAKVGKSLMGTVDKVGKFGGAIGLLTNPIGLAVGALGALTLGVIAYKHHQEKARQELINMGDAIDKAFDDYAAVEGQTNRTKELIKEYDRLKDKINNAKTPAAELTEARRKMADVEQELIDLNPDILRAEDAKSESFREQLGLADELNQSRAEMARREVEMSVMEGQADLPELVEEYGRLNQKLADTDEAYQKAKASYAQYSDYVNRQQEIVNDPSLSEDQESTKLYELAAEIEKATGNYYAGNWANLMSDFHNFKGVIDENYESWKKTQQEIIDTEQSFQSLYDNQKALIEMDLGGTIGEQASKYKELSTAEKQRFDAAMQDIAELNRAMDMIPDAKKVNIELVWQQTGTIPDMSTPAGKKLKQIQLRDPGFNGYAEGAHITSPELAWVGEGGDDEFIIPVNNSKRSHALYAAAGEALGYSTGGGNFAPVYSPVLNFYAPVDKGAVSDALKDNQGDWERKLKQYQQQQQRVSFK